MPELEQPSLEELDQRFVNAIAGERGHFWEACETADFILGLQATRKARGVMVGHLASLGHCTGAWIRVLAVLGATFGREVQYPDVSPALYRACIGAAKRTGRTAVEILDEAREAGWHVSQVHALGRTAPVVAILEADCPTCTAAVRVKIVNGTQASRCAHTMIFCPVCSYHSKVDEEMDPLGTLGLEGGAETAA